jgi:protein-tyrosine phosphatase
MYKFGAASPESLVFGAARPGYDDRAVRMWIDFMKQKEIQHICCLLTDRQLNRYSNLLDLYRQEFGTNRVCWAPIEDFQLGELSMLTGQILPFLATADREHQKAVVHCSGGIGRTGHVLAAWLVCRSNDSNRSAISTVIKTGRNPYEAAIFGMLKGKNMFASIRELNLLLDNCRWTATQR